jgi:hypothetical protein
MKSRFARATAVAVMVVAIAVTPLSTVFAGGQFETWVPSWSISHPTWVHVVINDQTGMVRAISQGRTDAPDGISNVAGDQRVLVASWVGGCADQEIELTLGRSDSGYVLDERTTIAWGCPFDIGIVRTVAIYLWSPIDAATVVFSESR